MTDNKPLVTSTGLGIAAGQIAVWLLEAFVLAEPIPSTVAVAIGTVLTGIIHYAKERLRNEKLIHPDPDRRL